MGRAPCMWSAPAHPSSSRTLHPPAYCTWSLPRPVPLEEPQPGLCLYWSPAAGGSYPCTCHVTHIHSVCVTFSYLSKLHCRPQHRSATTALASVQEMFTYNNFHLFTRYFIFCISVIAYYFHAPSFYVCYSVVRQEASDDQLQTGPHECRSLYCTNR